MTGKNQEKLFQEFPPVETGIWEKKIRDDLKGTDYEKDLFWNTGEGFRVKPYYRSEDVKGLSYMKGRPGEFPYTRGARTHGNQWEIRVDIPVRSIREANLEAMNALGKGAGTIGFDLRSVQINEPEEIEQLLRNIPVEEVPLNLITGNDALRICALLAGEISRRKLDPARIHGSLEFDPLGELSLSGKMPDQQKSFGKLAGTIRLAKRELPNLRTLPVNGYIFHQAGAPGVQEIALCLSAGAEYLSNLTDNGLQAGDLAGHAQLNLASGNNFFVEIAKFRAMRFLWAQMLNAFEPDAGKKATPHIHTYTSGWYQTLYDPWVNLLRGTTQAMSAILGGADSLTVRTFDEPFRNPGTFAKRIAINTQTILRHEAYLDKVADPGGGSYYIENLSHELISHSWNIFIELEKEGGYLTAFKKGIIQDRIETAAAVNKAGLSRRKIISVGTNQYPDPDKKAPGTPSYIKQEVTAGGPFRPLKISRLAGEFEQLRLKTEQSWETPPSVFLMTLGNPDIRRARAQFAWNFFATAGFNIVDNPGFKSAESAIRAAARSKAKIVVLCSSDEEYPDLAPAVREALKDQAIIVAAGAPPEPVACRLRDAGVEHFIHRKSNLLAELKKFQGMILKSKD